LTNPNTGKGTLIGLGIERTIFVQSSRAMKCGHYAALIMVDGFDQLYCFLPGCICVHIRFYNGLSAARFLIK
jgi:hypothetical protein